MILKIEPNKDLKNGQLSKINNYINVNLSMQDSLKSS